MWSNYSCNFSRNLFSLRSVCFNNFGCLNKLDQLKGEKPKAMVQAFDLDTISRFRPGTGDVPCLVDLDPSQFREMEDRPLTLVLQCCDGAHWREFEAELYSIIPGFKPHPVPVHGGAILLAPDDPRVNDGRLLMYQHEAISQLALAIHVKQSKIGRVICASHWPCGMAGGLGINEVDVIDLTLKGLARVEAALTAYFSQQIKRDPAGVASGAYAWANDVQVVPLLHVGYTEDLQETYFIKDKVFCEGLREGKIMVSERPEMNESLFDETLETSRLSEELALIILDGRRGG